MNYEIAKELSEELNCLLFDSGSTYSAMEVIVNSRVKDFLIVDDRSWAEQKW